MAKKSKKKNSKTKIRTKKNKLQKKAGKMGPDVILKVRVRDPKLKTSNPFKWKNVSTNDLFKNKKIVIVCLPGAFTPICSSSHLPNYEKKYREFKKLGIDDVYCLSVNDAFVMYNWGKKLKIKNVKLLPDGNGDFTKKMNALVKKRNLGFGNRSWRYSMYIDNCKIKKIFCENNMTDDYKYDPFKKSDVNTMLKYLEKYLN